MSFYTPRKSTRNQQQYLKSNKRDNTALLVPQRVNSVKHKPKDLAAKGRANSNRFSPLDIENEVLQDSEIMSSAESSPSKSPVKQKSRQDSDHITQPGPSANGEVTDPLLKMPSSTNMVSEQYIKESMMLLKQSFVQEIQKIMEPAMQQISTLNTKVDHIETKMGEFATAQNNLADDHEVTKDEVSALRLKLADMEDRNRRNNLKFRGIAEEVPPKELDNFLKEFTKTLLPNATELEMEIDRAHRLPRPRNIDPSVPRDVIARFHFYKTKDNILQVMRKRKDLPDPYKDIQVFIDLSQETVQRRRAFQPVTNALRKNDIPYRWGFPVKLIILDRHSTRIVHTPEQGLELLGKWKLDPEPREADLDVRTPYE